MLRIDNMVKRTKVERRIAMKAEVLAPMVALTLIVIAIASEKWSRGPAGSARMTPPGARHDGVRRGPR
jgi:hypothetical protein